ncbi:TlyA family RNA methyltransferase [Vampirovibrio sp.]|uniref:TlyA family RNA methyltransferase n=1 Tax=Vampirovibrio sp. TaxID=2717857 RepID=UPI0035934684
MAAQKERLDKLVVDRGLCSSRAQAQALIMDGKVRVKGEAVKKPGTLISIEEADITVSDIQPYVSRGGLKLAKALPRFNIQAQHRVCIDVGASTGGFTDCLLQHGASAVMAVDVGYGQLDWKLRSDQRVQVLEKTNIRELQPAQLNAIPSLGVVDTSFISLKKVLPPLSVLLTPDAEMVALLKPQFEHKDYLHDPGFKGVVKGQENHQRILSGVLDDLKSLMPSWALSDLDFSPITGPKGNIEFLLYYTRGTYSKAHAPIMDNPTLIAAVITKSYDALPLK